MPAPGGHRKLVRCERIFKLALEILPYTDEIGLFRQYHFNVPNDDPSNTVVLKSPNKIQQCPSDPNPFEVLTPDVSAPDAMTSSYRGVAGRGWYDQTGPTESYWDSAKATAADNMSLKDRGPLSVVVTRDGQIGTGKSACVMSNLASDPVRFKQITDGTSKTMMIGEYTTVTKADSGKSRSAMWANSVFGLNLGSISLPGSCRGNALGCPLTAINANTPTGGTGTQVTLDPDYNKCVDWTYPSFPQPCKRTFTGVHGGGTGINFVYADGSVHGLSTLTDIRILSCMATIAGGETVNMP